MAEPNVVVVEQEHEEELAAVGADFHLVVRGSNLLTGDAALEKAAEVAALVEAVVRVGVPRADVALLGVQAHVETGVFSKSTSASYAIRVRCDVPELFTDVFGAIVGLKNVELSRVTWRYDEEPVGRARRLHACAAEARRTAEAITSALGVRVVGVHRAEESVAPPRGPVPLGAETFAGIPPASARARGGGGGPPELGLNVAPTRRVVVRMTIAFLVEPAPAT